MEKTFALSDGKPCTVGVLGLFDLDHIDLYSKLPGEFFEDVEMGGKVVRKKYVPPETPPFKPPGSIKTTAKGSPEWHLWMEHEIYNQYIDHRRKEARIMSKYMVEVAKYIMNTCVAEEDRSRIVEKEDWRDVRRAALSVRMSREDLATALANTFPG